MSLYQDPGSHNIWAGSEWSEFKSSCKFLRLFSVIMSSAANLQEQEGEPLKRRQKARRGRTRAEEKSCQSGSEIGLAGKFRVSDQFLIAIKTVDQDTSMFHPTSPYVLYPDIVVS